MTFGQKAQILTTFANSSALVTLRYLVLGGCSIFVHIRMSKNIRHMKLIFLKVINPIPGNFKLEVPIDFEISTFFDKLEF